MRIATSALAVFACFSCPAQPPGPAFDVASLRLAVTGRDPEPIQTAPGSLTIRHQSLRSCLQWAYRMPRVQVIGPDWLNDIHLDIFAKASGPADETHLRLMLRTLLADRMGVKVHIERKEMQAYVLTVAKGGPKFHESTTEGPPPPWRRAEGVLTAVRVSMSDFAEQISDPLNRPVVDATGLNRRYDIRIDISSYLLSAANNGKGEGEMDVTSILFTGLQEQLGLRLDSHKETVDVLVIDHAEKVPTEN